MAAKNPKQTARVAETMGWLASEPETEMEKRATKRELHMTDEQALDNAGHRQQRRR